MPVARRILHEDFQVCSAEPLRTAFCTYNHFSCRQCRSCPDVITVRFRLRCLRADGPRRLARFWLEAFVDHRREPCSRVEAIQAQAAGELFPPCAVAADLAAGKDVVEPVAKDLEEQVSDENCEEEAHGEQMEALDEDVADAPLAPPPLAPQFECPADSEHPAEQHLAPAADAAAEPSSSASDSL